MSDPSAAEGVRQRNLARLLRLVHLEGPLSRARLTESTGLNRSTIADLVAELVREGLVVERAPDPSRRVGRPSPVVIADARVMAIAANPEVDALTIAAVGLERRHGSSPSASRAGGPANSPTRASSASDSPCPGS